MAATTKKRGGYHVCEGDIYELDVAFFWDAEQMARLYKRYFGIELVIDPDAVMARAYMHGMPDGSVRFAILMTERADWWHYAHECSHMVDFIFDQLGIDTGLETTEPRAYLMGFLFRELSLASPHLQKSQEENGG